jgi:hypothetical protein
MGQNAPNCPSKFENIGSNANVKKPNCPANHNGGEEGQKASAAIWIMAILLMSL